MSAAYLVFYPMVHALDLRPIDENSGVGSHASDGADHVSINLQRQAGLSSPGNGGWASGEGARHQCGVGCSWLLCC